jgi:hypothetical protein
MHGYVDEFMSHPRDKLKIKQCAEELCEMRKLLTLGRVLKEY